MYVLVSGLAGFLFLLGTSSNLVFTVISLAGFGAGAYFYSHRTRPVEKLLAQENQELAAIG